MIIHISSDLVEGINNATEREKVLFNKFLEKLFLAFNEGKHIVSINKRNLYTLRKYSFIDEVHKKYLSVLNSIKNKAFQSLENLIKQIEPSDVIIITYDKIDEIKNENINFRYISFFEFTDSETLSRSVIVSEHIKNDGVIYEKFFPAVYKQYKKLPFDFFLKKEMGGGSTIYSVLEEKCNEKIIGFHIFISDSDKKFVNDSYGKTASKILKTYERCKAIKSNNYLKIKLYILSVRELENLIPLYFFKEYNNTFYINCKIKDYEEYIHIDIKKELNEKKILKKFITKYNNEIKSFIKLLFNNCENLKIKNNWIEIGRIIYSWGVGIGKQNIL